MKITIIIPVLNEAVNILKIYNYLLENANGFVEDIFFIDGGSNDGSIEIFQQNNLTYYLSEKGRAKQMNLGAKMAKTEILYFLHVDSFPPNAFDKHIVDVVNSGYKAGCFQMKFDKNHWLLNICGWFTRFNFKICRGGDQSLFISKKLFDQLGGYDENCIIYEDNKFISKIYLNSKFIVNKNNLITSARRYEKNGIYKLCYHFGMIHLMNYLGLSNQRLLEYYQKNIN
jgi:rSAM/selenodomain-associated transferase 2